MYPGLLFIPFNLICHMTMFRKLYFWHPAPPSPKYVLKGYPLEAKTAPKKWNQSVQTLGHDPGDPMKIPSLSFVRRHTKFGLKIFEIDLVIEIKWYLTFGPSPRPLKAGDPKTCAVACAIHVSNSHTNTGWISDEKNWPPTPPPPPHTHTRTVPPKSHPWGITQSVEWKSRLICFISFILWEDTQSLV